MGKYSIHKFAINKKIIKELASMFLGESMVLVPYPHERKGHYYEPIHYSTALKNDLWDIAVFPGHKNWVVIKKTPLEFLGEKEPNKNRIRFSIMFAFKLFRFYVYNLYDSGPEILVKTDGANQY